MAGSVTSQPNVFAIRRPASARINNFSCTKCCRKIAGVHGQAVVILLFLLSWSAPGTAIAAPTADPTTPYTVDPAAAPEAVAKLQALSGDMSAGPKPEPSRLRAWIATHLHTLDRLLASSGLDLDELAAQAEPVDQPYSDGVGGPLLPAVGAGVIDQVATPRGDMLDLDRVRRVQAVLRAVPFSPPMSEYKLNSGFGYRKDPLNRRRALHTGLDFGGPRDAPVLATAPGEVIEAGRAGAYGIMVVVDHGMGLQTRYAHLGKAMVSVGDKVTIHQQVGVMGRTGRVTGPHLHYEIRLDGRPLNPASFLDAGGQLVELAGG